MNFIFPYILGIIIPTDFHIFQGWNHQPLYITWYNNITIYNILLQLNMIPVCLNTWLHSIPPSEKTILMARWWSQLTWWDDDIFHHSIYRWDFYSHPKINEHESLLYQKLHQNLKRWMRVVQHQLGDLHQPSYTIRQVDFGDGFCPVTPGEVGSNFGRRAKENSM